MTVSTKSMCIITTTSSKISLIMRAVSYDDQQGDPPLLGFLKC